MSKGLYSITFHTIIAYGVASSLWGLTKA